MTQHDLTKEVYLGDGLYASYDGYQIKLRAPTSDGEHVVYLDEYTLNAFTIYLEDLMVKLSDEK